MKVSIVVPVYGVEKFIERCARSLFEQTYRDIEYVFVDDCTPDRSVDVLLRVVEEYPDRKDAVRIIHNVVNKGLAVTRRIGISNCTGDFVYNIDSDDYIELTTISDLMEKQKETNADIVAAHMYINECQVTQNLITPDYHSTYDMLVDILSKDIHHEWCGRMVRRSLFNYEDIWTPDGLNVGEDWVMTSKLAYYARTVGLVDRHLYHYILTNEASYMHEIRTQWQTAILRNIDILFVVREFFVEHKENALTRIINDYIVRLHRTAIVLCLEKRDKLYYQKALKSSKRLDSENEMKIWGNSLIKAVMRFYPLAVLLLILKKTIM